MDERVIRELGGKLQRLERRSTRLTYGRIRDPTPGALSVSLGEGAPFTNVKALTSGLGANDYVAALVRGNDLLVLDRLGGSGGSNGVGGIGPPGPPGPQGATGPTGPQGPPGDSTAIPLTLGTGDNVSVIDTTPPIGQMARVNTGTGAAPITTVGPALKVAKTDATTQATLNTFRGVGGTPQTLDDTAAVVGAIQGTTDSELQVTGVVGVAHNAGTSGDQPDACGVFGHAWQKDTGATGRAIGGYFAGRSELASPKVSGVEIQAQNRSGTDDTYDSVGSSDTIGLLLAAPGVAYNNAGAMIQSVHGDGFPRYDCGIGFASNDGGPIERFTIRDDGASFVSHDIRGDHIAGAISVSPGAGSVGIGIAPVITTGSITMGTPTLVVASATGMGVGRSVKVRGAGAAGADLLTTISGIAGTTLTLADNASTTVTDAWVGQSISTAGELLRVETTGADPAVRVGSSSTATGNVSLGLRSGENEAYLGISWASGAFITSSAAGDVCLATGIDSTKKILIGRRNTAWDIALGGGVGFHGTAPQTKQAPTGSRGGNAALASLLTALATIGLITDSTSA